MGYEPRPACPGWTEEIAIGAAPTRWRGRNPAQKRHRDLPRGSIVRTAPRRDLPRTDAAIGKDSLPQPQNLLDKSRTNQEHGCIEGNGRSSCALTHTLSTAASTGRPVKVMRHDSPVASCPVRPGGAACGRQPGPFRSRRAGGVSCASRATRRRRPGCLRRRARDDHVVARGTRTGGGSAPAAGSDRPGQGTASPSAGDAGRCRLTRR